tara:strand:+ start:258 stop:449 length:192 start_codon:yes stop_codon:yes gene_type:complete
MRVTPATGAVDVSLVMRTALPRWSIRIAARMSVRLRATEAATATAAAGSAAATPADEGAGGAK